MSLESGTYISDLIPTNPPSTDKRRQGDDHLRLLKATIRSTFPNISGAVTPTHTELNFVDGVTSAIQTQLDTKIGASSLTPYAKLAVKQSFLATQAITPNANVSGSGSIILDASLSTTFIRTITGAAVFSTINATAGQELTIKIINQSGSAITFASDFHFPYKKKPATSTTAGQYDVITGKRIDNAWVCGILPNCGIGV